MCADGKRLGPVGGRIVAEVLIGLLHGDPSSYLNFAPSWQPDRAIFPAGRKATMADLVRFVQSNGG